MKIKQAQESTPSFQKRMTEDKENIFLIRSIRASDGGPVQPARAQEAHAENVENFWQGLSPPYSMPALRHDAAALRVFFVHC